MEIQVHYDNLADRKVKVAEREAQGLRMLYDNFDKDWKSGDEPHGTMTFTDVMPPTIIPEPVRDLASEIDFLKSRVKKLEVKSAELVI